MAEDHAKTDEFLTTISGITRSLMHRMAQDGFEQGVDSSLVYKTVAAAAIHNFASCVCMHAYIKTQPEDQREAIAVKFSTGELLVPLTDEYIMYAGLLVMNEFLVSARIGRDPNSVQPHPMTMTGEAMRAIRGSLPDWVEKDMQAALVIQAQYEAEMAMGTPQGNA